MEYLENRFHSFYFQLVKKKYKTVDSGRITQSRKYASDVAISAQILIFSDIWNIFIC